MAKVLIVEDSKMLRDVFARALEPLGYEVECWDPPAATEAAARLAATMADVIISDYFMPGCNGVTLARLAKGVNSKAKVLMVTANNDPELQKLKDRGLVEDVLLKPVAREQLIAAVEAVLEAARPKGGGQDEM